MVIIKFGPKTPVNYQKRNKTFAVEASSVPDWQGGAVVLKSPTGVERIFWPKHVNRDRAGEVMYYRFQDNRGLTLHIFND